MKTLVIVAVVAMLALTVVILAGGMDRVRRPAARRTVREPVREVAADPVVERVVEPEVVRERVVERPVVQERITERRIE